MSLRDRLNRTAQQKAAEAMAQSQNQPAQSTAGTGSVSHDTFVPNFGMSGNMPGAAISVLSEEHNVLKSAIHTLLVDTLTLEANQTLSRAEIRVAAKKLLEQQLAVQDIPMSRAERDVLVQQIIEEVVGYGPIEPLLNDDSITEIMVNRYDRVFIERAGRIEPSAARFKDDAHLLHIIERIVSAVGRRVDEKVPMVDARLKAPGMPYDGSRFNAIIPPLAIDGPCMTIRKFKKEAANLDKLLSWGSLTPPMAEILKTALKCHLNIIISGGTGSGKTTMLNSLSALIAPNERIITIEDAAELQLKQPHVVRLESRPPNIEGEGAIPIRKLLMNSLRMRPDRIVVGECRGGETLDMLQAMNTGHDGSLTTLHANTPRDALSRIETMCLMNDNPLPEKAIRQQVSSAVHMIVQVSRLTDGTRRTMSITEITGMEGDVVTMQEIYKFEQVGIGPDGRVIGVHVATGVRPRFADYCKARGIELPGSLFEKQDPLALLEQAQGGLLANLLPVTGTKDPLQASVAGAPQNQDAALRDILNRRQR